MEFQVGDKIICIDNVNLLGLTYGKKYNVIYTNRGCKQEWVHIINDKNQSQSYIVKRFISIEEYRRMKINKIKDEISSRY